MVWARISILVVFTLSCRGGLPLPRGTLHVVRAVLVAFACTSVRTGLRTISSLSLCTAACGDGFFVLAAYGAGFHGSLVHGPVPMLKQFFLVPAEVPQNSSSTRCASSEMGLFLGPCAEAHGRGGHVHRDMTPVFSCFTDAFLDRHGAPTPPLPPHPPTHPPTSSTARRKAQHSAQENTYAHAQLWLTRKSCLSRVGNLFALPSSSSAPLRRGREGERCCLPALFSGKLTDVRVGCIFVVFFLFFIVFGSCGVMGILMSQCHVAAAYVGRSATSISWVSKSVSC